MTVESYLEKLRGKNVLIHGLGLNGGGVSSAIFFLKHGFNVTVTDLKNEKVLSKSIEEIYKVSKNVRFVLEKHCEDDFKNANIVVKSPAIPPDNYFINLAKEHNAEIVTDIEIFINISPCNIYAITGSKGKSTTVSAVYNIFKKSNESSFIGGNITISPLTFYEKLTSQSLVILELSSWQLRDLKGKYFRFRGSGITNLMKDHQNYYKSMEDYLNDKLIITENQTKDDFILIPENDNYIKKEKIHTDAKIFTIDYIDKKSNIFFENGKACFSNGKEIYKLFDEDDIKLKGEHTKYNLLFAAGFSFLAGIPINCIKNGIKDFTGVPYRMQEIRVWRGIKFINDTTATIPEAAVCAIKSYKEPIIWIGGGNDKNLDFSCIKEIAHVPKKIYLLKGDGTEKMKSYLNRTDIIESNSLQEILSDIISNAKEGDIVLLSPGCTSFGLFQNEFHRGEVFNEFVMSLK